MGFSNLYISHAAKDEKLAAAVAALFSTVMGLRDGEMARTATIDKSHGGNFLGDFAANSDGPAVAIVLLTPAYLTSRYCLCEFGAMAVMAKQLIPLLVPPLEQKHVAELTDAKRLVGIDHSDQLNLVVARLQEYLSLGDLNLPRWAVEKKRFLAALPTLLD